MRPQKCFLKARMLNYCPKSQNFHIAFCVKGKTNIFQRYVQIHTPLVFRKEIKMLNWMPSQDQ